MDLGTFFRAVLRGWWLILLSTLVTAGSAAYNVSRQQARYEAKARVELRANPILEPNQLISANNMLDKRTLINTMARKATGSSMKDRIAKALSVQSDVMRDADITAVVVPDSNLIDIRTVSFRPDLAAAISNTITTELAKDMPNAVLQLIVVDTATPQTSPIEPQPTRTITLGVLFGVALGIVFALVGYLMQTLGVQSRRQARPEDGNLQGGLPNDVVEAPAASARTQQFFTQ